jgi:UDP-N-acetyl-D-glucosamine dehydrogenase
MQDLLDKLGRREAVVGIVGMGYVGIPLALAFVDKGLRVHGFDVDEKRIEALQAGRSSLRHLPSQAIAAARATGRFDASTDTREMLACDALIICVPTPLNQAREPDLSAVVAAAESLRLRPGQLVVLESTSWPGTTDEVVKPILERKGLRVPRDVLLAFSPEREDPGNGRFETRTIPKVVGADDPASRKAAEALYACAVERVVPVSGTRVAELTKLLENIFRSVNIALVNELKLLCERMGIDVFEVIDAAATKPFGYMPFYPGPGLGGHCVPIDPFYLTWKAREFGFTTRFIELAGEINTAMPAHVVSRVQDALNDRRLALNGARVLLLGVAYKPDIDDVRESPSLRLLELLERKGAQVVFHDPYVAEVSVQGKAHRSLPLTDEELQRADCVLIATQHKAVDYERVVRFSRLVVDSRNATRDVRDGREKIVSA